MGGKLDYGQVFSRTLNLTGEKREVLGQVVQDVVNKIVPGNEKILTLQDLKAAARSALSECSCKTEPAWRRDNLRIPNIVHLIRSSADPFNFTELVCFKSMLIHLRPDKIYLHSNVYSLGESDGYWSKLFAGPEYNIAERVRIKMSKDFSELEILGKVGVGQAEGDTFNRIQGLWQSGGIVLDLNILILRPLTQLRSEDVFVIPFGASPELDKGILLGSTRDSAVLEAAYDRLKKGPEAGYKADLEGILAAVPRLREAVGEEMGLLTQGNLSEWSAVRLAEDVMALTQDQLSSLNTTLSKLMLETWASRATEDENLHHLTS